MMYFRWWNRNACTKNVFKTVFLPTKQIKNQLDSKEQTQFFFKSTFHSMTETTEALAMESDSVTVAGPPKVS